MLRTFLAALAVPVLCIGCATGGRRGPTAGGTPTPPIDAPHVDSNGVPYVPLPGEPGYGEDTPTVSPGGVAGSGGLRDWLPESLDPNDPRWLRRPEETSVLGPRRRWPWEDRGLSRWERWFYVHGRRWLRPPRHARIGDGETDPTTKDYAAAADLKGARRWLRAERDRDLRRSAAIALGAWRPETAKELAALLPSIDGDRSAVLWALGSAGGQTAVSALIGALRHPKTPESERLIATIALGRAGGTAAVAALGRRLTDDEISDAQRGATAIAMGLTGDRTLVPGLTGLLANRDATPRVRAAALVALTRLDPAAGVLRGAEILRQGSGETAPALPLRLAAASALGETGRSDALEVLRAVLDGSYVQPRFERAALAAACGGLSRAVAARCRAALLKAVDERGALTAADALETAAGSVPKRLRPTVTTELGGLLRRVSGAGIVEDEGVRGLAALGLGRCAATADPERRTRAVLALRAALTDRHYAVRGFAALGLACTGDARARQSLRGLLRDGDPAVRAVGAVALGQLGDAGAAGPLVTLARRGPPQQRWGALWGLGLSRHAAALQPITRLLQRRSHPDLRATAAAMLATVPGTEARTLLEHTLRDRHANVRREAARALGMRTDASPARLLHALRDGGLDSGSRTALLDALAAAGPHGGIEAADVLAGAPAEVMPELAGALMRLLEPAYRPTRY